jgi:hypothetical protein
MAYLRSNRYQLELVTSTRVGGKPRTVVVYRFRNGEDLKLLSDSKFVRSLEKKAGSKLNVVALLNRARELAVFTPNKPRAANQSGARSVDRSMQTTEALTTLPRGMADECVKFISNINSWLALQRDASWVQDALSQVAAGQMKPEEFRHKLLSAKAPMPDALTGWTWENALGRLKARDQRHALSPVVSPSATQEKLRIDPLESWLERFLSVHLDEFIKRKEQGPTAPKPKFTKFELRELKEEIYKPTDGEDVYRFVGYLRNVRRVQQPTVAHLDEEWFHEYEAHLRRQFTLGPHMAEQKIARARKVYAAFHAWLKQQGH